MNAYKTNIPGMPIICSEGPMQDIVNLMGNIYHNTEQKSKFHPNDIVKITVSQNELEKYLLKVEDTDLIAKQEASYWHKCQYFKVLGNIEDNGKILVSVENNLGLMNILPEEFFTKMFKY